MRDLYIRKKNWVVTSFPFPSFWHLSPLSSLSSPSLSRWLPLSIQLISNRLYWHDWGILMVPELYKKEEKNMLYYNCLSVSSSLRSLSASLLSPCQRAAHVASTEHKLSPTSSHVGPTAPPLSGYFFLCCPPVNACNWNILFVFPIRDEKDVSMDGLEAMVDISACSYSLASF